MSTDGQDTWSLSVFSSTHTGVIECLATSMCISAFVCLGRHHSPPQTKIAVSIDSNEKSHVLTWRAPTVQEIASNYSNQDATRDGAYAVALVCVEKRLNLYAVGRAEDRSGADWLLAPIGYKSDTELPNCDDPSVVRLEVGGYNDESLAYQLKKKVRQLQVGDSDSHGIAAVVGFDRAKVMIQTGVLPGSRGGGST